MHSSTPLTSSIFSSIKPDANRLKNPGRDNTMAQAGSTPVNFVRTPIRIPEKPRDDKKLESINKKNAVERAATDKGNLLKGGMLGRPSHGLEHSSLRPDINRLIAQNQGNTMAQTGSVPTDSHKSISILEDGSKKLNAPEIKVIGKIKYAERLAVQEPEPLGEAGYVRAAMSSKKHTLSSYKNNWRSSSSRCTNETNEPNEPNETRETSKLPFLFNQDTPLSTTAPGINKPIEKINEERFLKI